MIEPILEATSSTAETTGTQAEAQSAVVDSDLLPTDDNNPDTNPHSALISGVVSAVEDKLHVTHTAMEDKVDSTKVALEGKLSSIEERVVKLDDIEKRVVKLDDIEKRVVKLDDIEERVVKLDEKITELTKILENLMDRLNT